MMVVPLFHRHRILTQVAADNVNIIKLLPPLICGQEEIDYFVAALDDVLADAHSGAGRAPQLGAPHPPGWRGPPGVGPRPAPGGDPGGLPITRGARLAAPGAAGFIGSAVVR